MESVNEVWRDVKGYEGRYQVSNLGRVRSLWARSRRRDTPKYLRCGSHSAGYRVVSLCNGGKPRVCLVHRLVAAAFCGDEPEGHEVNHIDGNKANNAATNLEYVTRRQNMQHAVDTGLMFRDGEHNPSCRSTSSQIQDGYKLVAGGMSRKQAAAVVGLTASQLCKAVRGDKWASLGLLPMKRRHTHVSRDLVDAVVKLKGRGMTQSQIISATGASKGTVYRILKQHQGQHA